MCIIMRASTDICKHGNTRPRLAPFFAFVFELEWLTYHWTRVSYWTLLSSKIKIKSKFTSTQKLLTHSWSAIISASTGGKIEIVWLLFSKLSAISFRKFLEKVHHKICQIPVRFSHFGLILRKWEIFHFQLDVLESTVYQLC